MESLVESWHLPKTHSFSLLGILYQADVIATHYNGLRSTCPLIHTAFPGLRHIAPAVPPTGSTYMVSQQDEDGQAHCQVRTAVPVTKGHRIFTGSKHQNLEATPYSVQEGPTGAELEEAPHGNRH